MVETPTPAPTVSAMALNITVAAKDANIKVVIDGSTKTDRLYKVGSNLNFTATKTIEIKTNQINSLTIKINDLPQPSGADQIWELVEGQVVKNL